MQKRVPGEMRLSGDPLFFVYCPLRCALGHYSSSMQSFAPPRVTAKTNQKMHITRG